VDSRDPQRYDGRFAESPGQGAHRVREGFQALGRHGRAEPRDAPGIDCVADADDALDGQPGVRELESAKAVDLQIDQPRCHPGNVVRGRGWLDPLNASPARLDGDDFSRVKAASENLHSDSVGLNGSPWSLLDP